MIFVAKIHNNSLGSCFEVGSMAEGFEKIKEMIDDGNFKVTAQQLEDLENNFEICFDYDPENITTFSIGMTE